MNVAEKLNRELMRLEGVQDLSGQPRRIQLELDQGQLTCELAMLDKIGCQLTGMRFATARLADASIEQLQQLGESLASRLSYLMEPISPIEIDPEGCVIQLRSNPPDRSEQGASYFELVVQRGGEIRLSRYYKEKGQPRQARPASVTREALARLASDLTRLDSN